MPCRDSNLGTEAGHVTALVVILSVSTTPAVALRLMSSAALHGHSAMAINVIITQVSFPGLFAKVFGTRSCGEQ